MAATFNWAQTHGASGSEATVDLGASGNLFNFKDIDDATAANYSSNPITASDTGDQGRSYEVWLRGHWTDTFNKIENLQFWMSTNFSPATGLTVYWKGNNLSKPIQQKQFQVFQLQILAQPMFHSVEVYQATSQPQVILITSSCNLM